MSFDRLLASFERIGDDSDRIQQFRKIAIALAISGNLDTPSTTMLPEKILEAVERVKATLVKKGELPKQKKFDALTDDDFPESFSGVSRFARLGSLARIEKGKTGIQQAQPGTFPLVVTAAERATCDHFDFDGAAAIVPLVSSTGHGNASLNRLHYQEGRFALGTILVAIFPHDSNLISARFIFEYLSAFKDELLVARMTGTANVTLSVGRVAEVPVPLVCPEVQTKVDELMTLCDRLQEARTSREAVRDRLTAASLACLTAPDTTAADFQSHARFALQSLPTRTTRPDQIKPLRQTILNLAVRGKLVAQNAADEPASKLLKRVEAEKARLIRAGKVRETRFDEPTKPILDDSTLPESWEQVTVANLASLRSGVALIHDEAQPTGEIPYLKVADLSLVENADGITTSSRFVDGKRRGDIIETGSIVFPKRGGAIATNRKRVSKVDMIGDSNLMAMKPYVSETLPFIELWFNSFDLWVLNSGTSVPQINNKDIYPLKLPLPPLAEQHRIVAKVDALMTLCDQLAASLTQADTTRQRLLTALLHEALDPVAKELEAAE